MNQHMKRWPPSVRNFILAVGRLADEEGVAVYLVGGMVRDLFLTATHFDLDLVVEGDGVVFARRCARYFDWPLVVHERFGTATLKGPGDFKADIVTARREVYERPGALPRVFSGGLRDDLFRRDFTVNAMAICLNRSRWGVLVDPYGGQQDLRSRRIAVLHSQSFRDDPTRILRAMRFEQRLGFRLEPETQAWLKRAVGQGMLRAVSPHRLRDELILFFKEADPWKPWKRLYDLCGFSFIGGGLAWDPSWKASFARLRRAASVSYRMYLALVFSSLPGARIARVLSDFAFNREERSVVEAYRAHRAALGRHLRYAHTPASKVFSLCASLPYETLALFDIIDGNQVSRRHIKRFLKFSSGRDFYVRGQDLLDLGLKPGPLVKKILGRLRDAQLDGKLRSRSESLALAGKWISP